MTIYKYIIGIMLMLAATAAEAQINIHGSVFGGARQANVGGSAFVNIGADNHDVVINYVYGGNDISGNIGTSESVPTEIATGHDQIENLNTEDLNTYNAFVRTNEEATGKHIFIGQLFGGGNGDYDYTDSEDPETGVVTRIITDKKTGVELARTTGDFNYPELDKTFVDIHGGTIGYVFGGGNLATVRVRTDIDINNASIVTTDDHLKSILGIDDAGVIDRMAEMGLNTVQTMVSSTDYQMARVFGGNNQADMAIRPIWHLRQGAIRDLYSGGNAGNMIHDNGIVLAIKNSQMTGNKMSIGNVYGGCRMADVNPGNSEKHVYAEVIDGISYPESYAARVYIDGGTIQNVYGGNDITGNVHGGNAVGIHTSILGNVYGGGNGSYPYTDNPALLKNDAYKDYYYNPVRLLGKTGTSFSSVESAQALNIFRPDAERVSIRISGTDEDNPVTIGGAIYCGGNSATLYSSDTEAKSQLKIGSYVIADKLFLGNNGEDMVKYSEADPDNGVSEGVLRTFAKYVDADGNFVKNNDEYIYEATTGATKFNSMNLSDANTFETYMDGCAMTLRPDVTFDTEEVDHIKYNDYTALFGSFYCGGNVGSMKFNGLIPIAFNHKVVIYEKLVGGCNNAYVPQQSATINNKKVIFNTAYEGGVIGNPESGTNNKLTLNLSGLKVEPRRWKLDTDPTPTEYPKLLVWNTVDANGNPTPPIIQNESDKIVTDAEGNRYIPSDDADLGRRLEGGNIYGGCYSSGVVNGNVTINLNATIMESDKLFDDVVLNDKTGEASLYDGNVLNQEKQFHIKQRHSGVILGRQGMDVFGKALNVFGGGKGAGTEIWGSTTINLNEGYVFQIFGGSEEGVIGKPVANGDYDFSYDIKDGNGTVIQTINKKYSYDQKYSCYVNLKGADNYPGVSKASPKNSPKMAECEFIYGGGFLGPIAGNTVINLGNGRIFNSFAGSCNADILGHTETYIGRSGVDADGHDVPGYPWIRDYVYGGNDLGGEIKGSESFSNRVRQETNGMRYNDEVLTASAYTEYTQGRAIGIFGGCYGTYDYKDATFRAYFDENGIAKNGFTKPRMDNAFVNFRPTYSVELKNNETNKVDEIYGAGQGYPADGDRDKMQKRSYVLIDIPQAMNNYEKMVVFGAGAWSGLGMDANLALDATDAVRDKHSAIIDLVRGTLLAAYGGSYQEGITRRTVINVPAFPTGVTSRDTLAIGSIFGGAYGTDTYSPCDVYEANVNYHNSKAALIFDPNSDESYRGAIYGGNNNERRTLYGRLNIDAEVRQKRVIQDGNDAGKSMMSKGTVYGAGQGKNTWSEYTEVNLNNGAIVYEVYGGGQAGKVFNAESVQNYIIKYKPEKWADDYQIVEKRGQPYTVADWKAAWTLGGGLDPTEWDASWKSTGYDPASGDSYWENPATNLSNPLVREAEVDDRDFSFLDGNDQALVRKRYGTNVIINKGAYVANYAYGGGYGVDAVVSGTTYIALLGGNVNKDIYAGGTSGSVEDFYGVKHYHQTDNPGGFMASANAYVQGGTVRNVYGGGWRGSVGHHGLQGHHTGQISDADHNGGDIDGESHVVIGNPDPSQKTYTNGIPSITRNVYGGGEGGTIFGDAYVTVNKGYIGYRYNDDGNDDLETKEIDERYEPELRDGTQSLDKGGNVFGGGYVANSYVDRSHVTMWDGIVRGSLYGGGEIGPIGRGTVNVDSLKETHIIPHIKHDHNGSAQPAAIYKGGGTHVFLYGGHVMRDVFGGGRGYDNWGGEGYMTPEEVLTMDRSSKGYVFGSTEVHIRGGEIGTPENVLRGYGNVFGGGNEGFVYSATGIKKGIKQNSDLLDNGIPSGGGGFYYKDGVIAPNKLTTDCRVDVEPYCKVIADDGISGFDAKVVHGVTVKTSYSKGEYVPIEALNQLKNRNNDTDKLRWAKLDTRGVTIHNALFAGGNISQGSDILSANTVTVYGNTAASLRDGYNYDLISLGTEDMGGLYGDGNLTLVDGFREIHIDNYGTDHYSLSETLNLEEYDKLTDRQKDYYKLKYVPTEAHEYEYWESRSQHTIANTTIAYRRGQKITQADYDALASYPGEQANWTKGKKSYQADDQIEEGEYLLMDAGEQANWHLFGVTSIYAGRPMNTIQRADMCGVFGSRLVLKGAEDRAILPGLDLDRNYYTINRVDEVSLNKCDSEANDTGEDAVHGNYFGIYNSVKYLGNLTSDVAFDAARETRSTNDDPNYQDPNAADGTTTYRQWKEARPQAKNRNNGISRNKVALASGVYLEIKREEGEITGTDDWGYITGVIELDLINVMPGMGGGYVYAKNEHGTPGQSSISGKVTLLDYNQPATTYRRFAYTSKNIPDQMKPIETSGNFVHYSKQIVDDCYPNGGIYKDGYVESPAHYWYIRGSIYVYEQTITAYTGAANATAEKKEIPLTITAASNGRMILSEVQPNFYAYYDKYGNKIGSNELDTVFVANNKSYKLNQPISYWDYQLLGEGDRAKFVPQTYVVIDSCKVNGNLYVKGDVLLPEKYDELKLTNPTVEIWGKNEQGQDVKIEDSTFDYVFRLSNNLSHDKGYILTYDVNNPMVWNNYYTETASPGQADALNTKQYDEGKDKTGQTISRTDYTEGPTYTLNGTSNGVFGQQKYRQGSIIFGSVVTNYNNEIINHLGENPPLQATVERAYVVTQEYSVKDDDGNEVQHLNPGTPIYKSKYNEAQWAEISRVAEEAKVCTSLLEFTTTDYIYAGQVLSSKDIAKLKTKAKEKNPTWTDEQVTTYINQYLDDAYYCKVPEGHEEAYYGGTYFQSGHAYAALDTWCSMSATERQNFTFNYDALDLLIDPNYSGQLGLYDGTLNPKVYSASQPIDYQAEYTSNDACAYYDENNHPVSYTKNSPWLSREQYEDIPNEKRHYTPITVTSPEDTYYMVNTTFRRGDIPYTVGQQINEDTYQSLSAEQRNNIDKFKFTPEQTSSNGDGTYNPITYYYCRENYTINEKGEGMNITTVAIKTPDGDIESTEYKSTNPSVPQGAIITESTYNDLANYQTGFIIHGTSPTEVSTLYVSNESDINDLKTEKIITVIYVYEYDESDDTGTNVTPVSERHVLNIHIKFESGVPEIGDISKPSIVLPGTTIGMNVPTVTEGAFKVTDAGWEIFATQNDADTHTNGKPFVNNETKLYWYQDNYKIAYWALTKLGKSYSKAVPLSVANYHDLKKVMDDKEHHYYIDHLDADREPKIYINDYKKVDDSGNETEDSQNGLDLLKNLIDLSHMTKTYTDPTTDDEGNKIPPQPIPFNDPDDPDNPLNGHIPLERTAITDSKKPMRGGKYLEFFMRTDIDHDSQPWTPIANNEGECFSGVLHGDGHTISGLVPAEGTTGSLINHLCGDVYNLGVTGSFTGGGIADTGEDGYMENCWIKTTGTPTSGIHPLYGNPGDANASQVVNCYYLEEDDVTAKYTPFTDGRNKATKKPARAFYNGEVAYNLNGFYLYKRYSDKHPDTSGTDYKYWKPGETDPQTGYYGSNPTLCSSGYNGGKYVEDRFADGDFIYADGSIPGGADERLLTDADGNPINVAGEPLSAVDKPIYYPKWPEDYLFFGQTLDYGYGDNPKHQEVPSAVTVINRVYRAPAYFRTNEMKAAHFNANAVFAKNKKGEENIEAYKDMTAIDFTGGNGDVVGGYMLGDQSGRFYPPLLDDGGLTGFSNQGLTRNLLVYTGTVAPASSATNTVVSGALTDEAYAETASAPVTTELPDPYRYHTVNEAQDHLTESVRGHWVELTEAGYVASRDHFLVDKQDFFAPIGYTFTDGTGETEPHRMWYQRLPENYVGKLKGNDGAYRTNAGWEGVCLPFKADIVTTNEKGEITHFYNGSWTSSNNSDAKIGHEYWLRGFAGGSSSSEDPTVYVGTFNRPAVNSTDGEKEYTNTFLWDYYYSYNDYRDLNSDTYQEQDPTHTYYKNERTYTDYPRLAGATPYIIGFPGERYYEFDLSGVFEAGSALPDQPAQLAAQIITFASKPGERIDASDDKAGVTYDKYTFCTNYLNRTFAPGTANTYTLNADGSSYDKIPAVSTDPEVTVDPVEVYAFRPYFTVNGSNDIRTRSIIFSEDDSQLKGKDDHSKKDEIGGTLEIYAKKHKIIVESSLNYTVDVRIVNMAGITIRTFAIEPGETIETRINVGGVYIVQPSEAKYIKKLSVK